MSNGFKDQSLNKIVIENQFKKCLLFVSKAIDKMREDLIKKGEMIPNHEEKIRNYLYENYLNNYEYKEKELPGELVKFDIESQENFDSKKYIYVGRTDIRMFGIEIFSKKDAYNIIECKRIDGTLTLNKKYINDGLKRFTTKKYSSYMNQNAMLGFIVKDIDICKNTQKIDDIQRKDNKIEIVTFRNLDEEKYMYEGIYNNNLKIFHIFSDISSVIIKNGVY